MPSERDYSLDAVRQVVADHMRAERSAELRLCWRELFRKLQGDDVQLSARATSRLGPGRPAWLVVLAEALQGAGETRAAAAYAMDAMALAGSDGGLIATLAERHGASEPGLAYGAAFAAFRDEAASPQDRARLQAVLKLLKPAQGPRPPSSFTEALKRRLRGPEPSERDGLRLALAATLPSRPGPAPIEDLRLLAGLRFWPELAIALSAIPQLGGPVETALRRASVALHARDLPALKAATERVPPAWLSGMDPSDPAGLRATAMEARRKTEPAFVLISGPMRSGSTLLANILYSASAQTPRHIDIALVSDGGDILRRHGLAQRADSVEAVRDGRIDVQVEHRLTGASTRPAAALRSTLLGRIAFDAPTVAAPKVVGVKSTGLTHEFDLVRQAFNTARLILTIRDPRAIVASNLRRHAERPASVGLTSLAQTLNMMEFMAGPAAAGAHVVHYEAMVREPDIQVRRVLRFLKLDESRYDWDALVNGVSDNSSWRQGGTLSTAGHAIASDSVDRWRTELLPEIAAVTEALCAPYMEGLGYGSPAAPLDAVAKAWAREALPQVIAACEDWQISPVAIMRRSRDLGLLD